MKTTVILTLALALLAWCAPAQAESYKYDQPVTLEGTLVAKNSDPKVTICDITHPYLVLQLAEPLDAVCFPWEKTDCIKENGIGELHLLLSDSQQAQYRKLKGKKVKVSGVLHHAETSHHFTEVVLEVKDIQKK